MDRDVIKKTIETMLLTCPYDSHFPDSIITLLEDSYEECWEPKKQSHDHPQIAQFRDRQYFSSTGISYFISWLAKTHERKIRNMSSRSKAALLAIVCRTTDPAAIQLIHRIVASDAIDYVHRQRR